LDREVSIRLITFDEHLDIDELIAAVRIIARFVYRWTNTERSANNNIK